MKINYRAAVSNDEQQLFSLASRLATSFKLKEVDFSDVYYNILNDSSVDLIIAEYETKVN